MHSSPCERQKFISEGPSLTLRFTSSRGGGRGFKGIVRTTTGRQQCNCGRQYILLGPGEVAPLSSPLYPAWYPRNCSCLYRFVSISQLHWTTNYLSTGNRHRASLSLSSDGIEKLCGNSRCNMTGIKNLLYYAPDGQNGNGFQGLISADPLTTSQSTTTQTPTFFPPSSKFNPVTLSAVIFVAGLISLIIIFIWIRSVKHRQRENREGRTPNAASSPEYRGPDGGILGSSEPSFGGVAIIPAPPPAYSVQGYSPPVQEDPPPAYEESNQDRPPLYPGNWTSFAEEIPGSSVSSVNDLHSNPGTTSVSPEHNPYQEPVPLGVEAKPSS